MCAIPQTILDRLTDVAMPRLQAERPAKEMMAARGFSMPAHRCETLVLGSGAAGLRAAVELKRRDVDVVVASQSAFGGTSACSGSDKQTLHTANGAGRGDDFRAMAAALGAGPGQLPAGVQIDEVVEAEFLALELACAGDAQTGAVGIERGALVGVFAVAQRLRQREVDAQSGGQAGGVRRGGSSRRAAASAIRSSVLAIAAS